MSVKNVFRYLLASVGVSGFLTAGYILGSVSEKMKSVILSGCEVVPYDCTSELLLAVVYLVSGYIVVAASLIINPNKKEVSKDE